ncbi:hypothetical protein IFM89_031382 [Coptis chinensis]|uniref:Uncharacterized protein n=1 Tax=Coptis chinensis TaxID=261450 RepID=A0A835I4B6_9MAGN|nr:hypothetical protein IFM89_031382 [Coptis chinensis]
MFEKFLTRLRDPHRVLFFNELDSIATQMGLKLIKLAAFNGYHGDVEYLFPVTLCIPTCSDWSIT